MKPISTAAAVLPDSQDETENGMNDIRTAEPNWQLLGDVVRKILIKTTADYLNRKEGRSMPNPYKIQSSGDPRVKRIVDVDGNIVAFAMAMANGTWRLFDPNDKPLSRTNYASAVKACTGYRSMVETFAKDA